MLVLIKIKIHFLVFYFDRYKTRGEFASDARLVFNNCMIFNEDESDVGKAGHSMRKNTEIGSYKTVTGGC
jgi:hypothetical protein